MKNIEKFLAEVKISSEVLDRPDIIDLAPVKEAMGKILVTKMQGTLLGVVVKKGAKLEEKHDQCKAEIHGCIAKWDKLIGPPKLEWEKVVPACLEVEVTNCINMVRAR